MVLEWFNLYELVAGKLQVLFSINFCEFLLAMGLSEVRERYNNNNNNCLILRSWSSHKENLLYETPLSVG